MELQDCIDLNLVTNRLPTICDVIRGMNFVLETKRTGKSYHTKLKTLLPQMAEHVIDLWQKSNIPTICKKSVVNHLLARRSEYIASERKQKRKSNSTSPHHHHFRAKLI